jgi:hypothetical protein
MKRTRVAKLWAEYRYRVGRARFDFDTEVKPEEFIELLEALLDEEESPVACGHQCHTAMTTCTTNP